ncbi:prephenate dehydrogenase [Eubacterium oxidoreducens]|uniref:Prephenate dehydrogenase n=1 Tax=Eubacterium oxidoreducens TaxID=1732 RepID=A0A1G6AKS6_EUBOX|nr:prephenate dehydrogenase [Eubacterium oxidoreducens]SDB09012.1 prephenate dehydrogenase [Eubacterium oxidoreducens]
MHLQTVGIIGLGLIGGSMAKTIKKHMPNIQILAYDKNQDALIQASSEKVIDGFSHLSVSVLEPADLIILCAEVKENIQLLNELKPYLSKETIISDVGSVKEEVVTIMKQEGLSTNFIGGHPMAGSEKSGYENATDFMFENVYYILTPTEDTPEHLTNSFSEFLLNLKILPKVMTPQMHDYATAAVSHFPHILASSLVNVVSSLDDEEETFKQIAAGGFKDITRIASSSPEMWRQICLSNKSAICDIISAFKKQLDKMEQFVCSANSDQIYHFFEDAKNYRDSLQIKSKNTLEGAYEFYCDLVDKPGGIATITTILACNQLSIKNIGIIHNREYEQGVLRLSFYDNRSYNEAIEVLQGYNYTIYER